MRTTLLLRLCLAAWTMIYSLRAQAQEVDTTISLNLLRAPSSPAANLLGILPSDIHQPTDVTAFMVSLQNATGGFNGLPANFAVDVAPFWLLGQKGQNVSFSDYQGNRQRFWERVLLSAGVRTNKTKTGADSAVQVGTGIRISILRGRFNDGSVAKVRDYLTARAASLSAIRNTLEGKDSIYQRLDKQVQALSSKGSLTPAEESVKESMLAALDEASRRIEAAAVAQVEKQLTATQKALENEPLRRYGCKVDLSAGVAWNFADARFGNGKLFRAGVWLTGGYEWQRGGSLLFIARYLQNPDKVFADDWHVLGTTNVGTFDMGAKYTYSALQSPFSASTEFIYRSALSQTLLPSSWRWTANLNYEVAKNTVLTLAVGRDFDRTFKQDGNVIALLNLIKGFGSTRNLNN